MNCCDYDCTQGRDCPARQKPTPADELQRLQGEARVMRGLLRQSCTGCRVAELVA